jgi:hypothetical protein
MTTGRLSYTLQGTQPVTGWLARYAAAFVTAEVCQRRLNFDPLAAWRFLATVATTSEILGGCVVIVSSCGEGAWAASAVGQASAVR